MTKPTSDSPKPGRSGPVVGALAVLVFIGIIAMAYGQIEPLPSEPAGESEH